MRGFSFFICLFSITACQPSASKTKSSDKAVIHSEGATLTPDYPAVDSRGAKLSKCRISSGSGANRSIYQGPCYFFASSNGSFSVNHAAAKPLINAVTMVTVSILESGEAEVRGLTVNGNNSRWGPAKRSASDKACWLGSDFEICAYKKGN